jgi:hypothetical protein
VEGQIETNKAVQNLAHQIARERGITLTRPHPEPDQPRPKSKSYRLTNVTRGEDGGLAADVEYSDGRVRHFQVKRDENGDLEGELDDVADAEPVPAADAGAAPSSSKAGPFASVFGSIEEPPP